MPTVVIPNAGSAATEPADTRVCVLLEPEAFVGLYDRLEVWRSKLGVGGPYEELTDAAWLPARVPTDALNRVGSPSGAYAVVAGLDLLVELGDSTEVHIVFVGPDPLTYAQVAAQVGAQGLGKVQAYVDPNGTFVLESVAMGAGAALLLVEGTACPALNLTPGTANVGKSPRLVLDEHVTRYDFVDPLGKDGFFYKRRLRNSVTGAVSEFSGPVSTSDAVNVPVLDVVMGTLDLARPDGSAAAGVRVVVDNTHQYARAGGYMVAHERRYGLTDKHGHVEFALVRGLKATVSVSESSIVRDIIVPTDPALTSFDLLGPEAAVSDDVFKVQRPVVINAERRSW